MKLVMTLKSKISSSPDRYTFLKESYINRQRDIGADLDDNTLKYYDSIKIQASKREAEPDWSKDNLEYDLRTTDWILEKVRQSDEYAQNLYAALCNNDFMKLDILPILKEQTWSCSWRYAGGIIADMKEQGDYIDWYCSGHEGKVTDEIREDLKTLGWAVVSI